MKCPKCGQENETGLNICIYCKTDLTDEAQLQIRTSKAAIASLILALATVCIITFFLIYSPPNRRSPHIASELWSTILLVPGLLAISFGAAGLAYISVSGGRLAGRGFAVIGIAAPIVVFFVVAWLPVLTRTRSVAFRNTCGSNLSGIGMGMLIYANDYEDEFPRAGGKGSRWTGKTPYWEASLRQAAFSLNHNGSGGQASITASLYLLVKYAEVKPLLFVCKGDIGVTEFMPKKYGAGSRDLIELWDFGPNPIIHCSYAYQMPFSQYRLTTACDPNMAIAADRNPFQDSPFQKAKDIGKFSLKNRESIKQGNTYVHKNEGQNVLFLDSHTSFAKTPCCGINEDNIYTIQDGNDIKIGKAPVVGSEPVARQDSLLVTDGKGD